MNEHQVSHASKKRAISLDLARGYMLLLIVLAHVPLYLYAAEPLLKVNERWLFCVRF